MRRREQKQEGQESRPINAAGCVVLVLNIAKILTLGVHRPKRLIVLLIG